MILTAQDKSQLVRKIHQANIEFPVVANIEHGDIRSTQANARYWAAIVTATQNHLERETGVKYAKEAIHHMFKVEKYGKKADEINGHIYERCARSSKFTVKQFAKFSEWAELYAIDTLGVDPIEIDGLHGESE